MMYSYLKTYELASSIKKRIGDWVGLSPENLSNIHNIKDRTIIVPVVGPVQQRFINVSDYTGGDTIENRLVQYVTAKIPSERQVLGLVIEMCSWEPKAGQRALNLSFLNIRAIVEVLKDRAVPIYYLYALRIYQSILLENRNVDGVLDDLCNLPITTKREGEMGYCCIPSIRLQAKTFEELKKYTKAVNLYREIDVNDPKEVQDFAAKKIQELTPLAEKEGNCIIL